MALISASRMNDLKARVKAECQKRSKTGDASGSASVSSYGGTSYDFSTKPAQGVKITKEHNTKNATPLNAINANVVTSSIVNATSVSDSGLTTMEAFVTTLETRQIVDKSGTDCKSGCTGACYGCTGTCTGTCTDTCTDACTGCTGTCSGSCTSCTGTCSGSCTSCSGCSGCTWYCQDDCMNWCAAGSG